jgi:hypothetical protein
MDVSAAQVRYTSMEIHEEFFHIGGNMLPGGPEKAGPKPVRSRSASPVHAPDRGLDLLVIEGGGERQPVRLCGDSVEGGEIDPPARGPRPAQHLEACAFPSWSMMYLYS